MNPPDFRKLITGFLASAIVVSSFAVAFSYLAPTFSASQPARNDKPIPSSAFVEKLPTDSINLAPAEIKTNITDDLVTNLSQKIVEANPDGPVQGKIGFTLNTPDMGSIGDYLASSSISLLPTIADEKILIKKTFTPDDVVNYISDIKRIVSTANKSGYQFLAQAGGSQNDADALNLLFQKANEEVYGLQVPAPLMGFHKSILVLIQTQADLFDSKNDPIRTLILINGLDSIFQIELRNMEREGLRAQSAISEILPGNKELGTDNFLIHKAYAQWAVTDLPLWMQNAIKYIKDEYHSHLADVNTFLQRHEWLRKLLTEQLKDRLVHRLVQQVIQWVNGGGKPQFITNWQGFIQSAGISVAEGIIQQKAPGLCQSFAPLLKVQLLSQYSNSGLDQQYNSCNLEQIVRDVRQFYNDFSNGSWGAYVALAAPSGNYYGSLFSLNTEIQYRKQQAEEAAKLEASAGQGYKSQKTCTDPIQQQVKGDELPNARTLPDYVSDTAGNQTGSPDPNKTYTVTLCNPSNGNAWQVTTPGNVLSGAVNNAVTESPFGRIVNANDLTALTNAVVNAALTKLMSAGQKGLFSLNYKNLNTGGSLNDTCAGLSGDDLTNCQSQAGQIENTEKNNPDTTGAQSVADDATTILENNKKTLPIVGDIINAIKATLDILSVAKTSCTSNQDVQTYINSHTDQLNSALSAFNEEKTRLEAQISGLPDFISGAKAQSDKDPNESPEQYYNRKQNELNSSFGGAEQSANAYADAQDKLLQYASIGGCTLSELERAKKLLESCALPPITTCNNKP